MKNLFALTWVFICAYTVSAQECAVSCLAFDVDKKSYSMSYEEYLQHNLEVVLLIKNKCAGACTYRFGRNPLLTTEYGKSPLIFEVYQLTDDQLKLMYVTGNDTACVFPIEDPVTGEFRVEVYTNELLKGEQTHEK